MVDAVHRLDYWTLIVGPKFSKRDRQAINLSRYYSLQQVEYCRNLIFRRNFPIHKLFERSCDLGLLRLSADRISQVFGWRLHQRLPGKLSSVLERTEHGHHVLRAYAKNAVMRMYEKFSTFLRLEALSNNLKDFGLNKGLDNLDKVRRVLGAVTDRFAQFEAQALDLHVDFPPVSTPRAAYPARRRQNPRHQTPRHPHPPPDGGPTARRHQGLGMAYHRHPSSDSYKLRSHPRNLHPHPTPL